MTIEQVQATFPGWRIFESDRGRFWATRGTSAVWTEAPGQHTAPAAVDADTLPQLAEALGWRKDDAA